MPRVSPSVQRITVTLLERLTENSLVNFGHLEVLSRLHAVGYGVVSCGGRSWPHVCVQMRPERFWGLGNVRCKWVNWTHCRPLGTSLERRWNPLSDGLRPVPRDIYIHAYIHILFLQNGMAYKTRSIWKNVGPIRHWEPLHAALPFTRCHRLRIDVHNNNDDDDDDDNDNAWQRGPLWPHKMGPTKRMASAALVYACPIVVVNDVYTDAGRLDGPERSSYTRSYGTRVYRYIGLSRSIGWLVGWSLNGTFHPNMVILRLRDHISQSSINSSTYT